MKKTILKKIIVYGLLVMLLLYAFRYRILKFINEKFVGECVIDELTEEQKLEDFNSFYTTIAGSVPFLDEINDLYQIDFRERYEYYQDKIKEAEDNFEFYCTLEAICRDVPSFHTDICFPLYSNVSQLDCYDSQEVLTSLGRKSQIDAWTKIIEAAVYEYEDVNMLRFSYVEGKYLVDDLYLTEAYEQLKGYELVTIDGINADDYLTQNISTFHLRYDCVSDKPYRESYVLNDRVGEKVDVLLQNEKGEQCEQIMYLDYGAEVVADYGYLFSKEESQAVATGRAINMYRDDENQLEYVEVNNFGNPDGKELKKYLEESPYDTIVIDLRSNYGGKISYAQEYLYPALYKDDVTQTYHSMVPDTKANKAMTKNWIVRLLHGAQKDEDFYYYSLENTYRGEAKLNKNVYYLVGPGTGSAADTYVSMIKENGLGTIVGDTTGGEGLGASFICDYMKNSSLIYVYYPSIAYEYGTSKKLYEGTKPDYYASRTREEFLLRQQYVAEGVAWEYHNQLEHDAVLKWVVENLEK